MGADRRHARARRPARRRRVRAARCPWLPAVVGPAVAAPGPATGTPRGWLLSEAAVSPAPPGGGGGGYGDADLAASSEADEAERTRLIALVDLARSGDVDAFGLLYDHYQGSVYRFLFYRTRSTQLAEDLTSETFFRALRSMNNFRWQGKDFGAWLMTIARNLCTDHFKAGRTRLEITTEDMGDHDDATEGPENAVLAVADQRAADGGADPAARRAAGLPGDAVPAGAQHRRDRRRPRALRRRREAAPAARRTQPREAAARGGARMMRASPKSRRPAPCLPVTSHARRVVGSGVAG